MEGVEFLDIIFLYDYTFIQIILTCFGVIGTIITGLAMIFTPKSSKISCLIFFSFLILTIFEFSLPKYKVVGEQYLVKISSSVSLNEFYEHYHVIEKGQYSNIYLIEEWK